MPIDSQLQSLYGLKYNPFSPDLPLDALWGHPELECFGQRLKRLTEEGGFALLTGEVGLGKSKTLQLLAHRLRRLPEVVVAVMQRPQSNLSDFYRELGDLFGVRLAPANRYGGFKLLRERWEHHFQSTLRRPVLLIDESQQVSAQCLTELRLLGSERFDSRCLLTVVLCGDTRLPERFRTPELLPLGSRIAARLTLEPYTPAQLREYLHFALEQAGAVHLMTEELQQTIAEHAAGNLRVLTHMASDLLAAAAAQNRPQLDEKLYLELFRVKDRSARRAARAG